jgi:hypothetical protein
MKDTAACGRLRQEKLYRLVNTFAKKCILDAAGRQKFLEVCMKKLLSLFVVVFLVSGSLFAAGGKIIFNVYADGLSMPINNLTGQASQYKVYFEAKAAVEIWQNLYLWASHGYLTTNENWTGWSSKDSFEQDIRVERQLAKRIVSGGVGYFIGYFEKDHFAVRADVGICSITNSTDKTTSDINTNEFLHAETAKQGAIGARGNLAFTYGIYKNIFAELSGGYMYVFDKIDDVRTNLGGWHLQLGLGINL